MLDKIFAAILTEADKSHDEIRRLIRKELQARSVGQYVSIRDVFDSYIVYTIEPQGDMYNGERLYRRNYTVSDSGKVEFGDTSEVSVQTEYVAIGESAPATEAITLLSAGNLIESADNGEGWKWRVQVIQSGISKNKTEYPLDVLHKRAPLYEGVTVYYGGADHSPAHRGFSDVGGWITQPTTNARGIEGTFEINKGKPELRETFMHAWDVSQRTGKVPFGFSHVIPAGKFKTTVRRLTEGLVRRVDDFTAVDSVDIVMRPSAGGELIGLVAAVDEGQERSLRAMDELLARLRRGEKLTEAEMTKLATEAPAELAKALTEAAKSDPTPSTEPAQPENDGRLTEAERRYEERIKLSECRLMLVDALSESKLPEGVKAAIREDFDGVIFDEAKLTKRIERDRKLAASIAESAGAGMPNAGTIEITEDEHEKHRKALDGLFENADIDGVPRFQSIKQAFRTVTNSRFEYIDGRLPMAILSEATHYAPESMRLTEAIDSTTWGQMLGDSITRKMIKDYDHPAFGSWDRIVTDKVPLSDFRDQKRTRYGGYGDLPIVGEGATYQNTDSPPDEETSYGPDKRGYLEQVTIETVANDDVGALRRLPTKMGRAAARTLYFFIWNTMIRDNPTVGYDSKALFHADHANTGTSALSATALLAVENAMRNQTAYGESGHVLGGANMPKILAIPNELRETAFRLVGSPVMSQASGFNATEPNMFQGGYEVIVIDDWTNAADWFAFANPQDTPILEVGFLNGREEPELFVQDQPTVGSMFTADKITYKIRHIYGAVNLDHRGVYRNDV